MMSAIFVSRAFWVDYSIMTVISGIWYTGLSSADHREFYLFSISPFFSLSLIFRIIESLVRINIDNSCLSRWIDWSDRQPGHWGHWSLCFRGLPWLINDRDESVAPLLVFSIHYNQMLAQLHQSHAMKAPQMLMNAFSNLSSNLQSCLKMIPFCIIATCEQLCVGSKGYIVHYNSVNPQWQLSSEHIYI